MQQISIASDDSILLPTSSPNSKVKDTELKNMAYYWIYVRTKENKKLVLARFYRHVPGFSIYLGSWELFEGGKKIPHDELIEVVREIQKPKS